MFNSGDFYRVFSTRDSPLTPHNEIPFERWMEILDENESFEKGAGDDYPVTEYAKRHTLIDQLINIDGISEAIKEHQRQCKEILEIANMDESDFLEHLDERISALERKNELINELREDIKHINFDQYAGYSRIILEKVKELTSL